MSDTPITSAAGRFADLYATRRPHWLLGRIQPRRRCAVCGHRVSRARHMLGLTVCCGYCYAVKYQGKQP